MILRKINACVSLLTTIMLLKHAIFNAVWMLSGCSIEKPVNGMSHIMFVLMMVHAIISIFLGVLGHKGAEKRKCNNYANLNKSTNIQRMSGVFLIPLTVLHIAGTLGFIQPPKLVHAMLPPIFFAVALMHVAISTGRAFITLGIGNARLFKVVDITVKVICGATFIADITGFYLYVC